MNSADRTHAFGWNEIYSNERWAFAGVGVGTVTRDVWVAARKAEGFPIIMACRAAGCYAKRSMTGRPVWLLSPPNANVTTRIWSSKCERFTPRPMGPTGCRG